MTRTLQFSYLHFFFPRLMLRLRVRGEVVPLLLVSFMAFTGDIIILNLTLRNCVKLSAKLQMTVLKTELAYVDIN